MKTNVAYFRADPESLQVLAKVSNYLDKDIPWIIRNALREYLASQFQRFPKMAEACSPHGVNTNPLFPNLKPGRPKQAERLLGGEASGSIY
jgi:hypothetical protein